jgi:hypothetical protein
LKSPANNFVAQSPAKKNVGVNSLKKPAGNESVSGAKKGFY